tara:strand:+ start:199 stop:1647 length:1449 start_codon:yes stop_codon:yes gene_type:complete
MGFDAKAFAAAFATEIAGGIKERTAEAKKFKEEEKAKAERNLTIFQKRIAQKDAVTTYANTLSKLGATDADIMYFAKDGPAVLKSIHDKISDKAKAYYNLTGNKLSPETVSKMMNIPKGFEEAASKYDSLDKFLDAGYRLSQENDEFEQPENEEILAGNFLLGIMGVGAKERVRRKLETEKYIGDTTIGQLNRIAAQRDFVDVFGGEFSRAALDPTIGPRILDRGEVADVTTDTNSELIRKTTGTKGNDNLTAFMIDKLGKSEKTTNEITAIFMAMNDATKEATLTEAQKGYLKEFKEKMLYDAFIEESAGMNLKPSEISFFGKDIEEVYKTYAGDDTDTTTTKKKDEVGGEVKKEDTKIMSLPAQQLEMKEQIANGTLQPGDVYIFTDPKDGSTEEITVPEVKTELEQEVEDVQTSEPMDKEAFDGLPDKVGAGGALRKLDRLYGLTHNRNGIKKSYDQYVQDFLNSKQEKVVRTSSKRSR